MNVKRVHVIVNPASGQDKPILKTLNSSFQDNGIEWEMFMTKEAGRRHPAGEGSRGRGRRCGCGLRR